MSSRAALLLQREQYKLSKSELPWGVSLGVVKNDIFHWQAIVEGLPETPWEGGIFQLELFFDEDYNEVPPDIYFVTVPFHPNVDMKDGRPCIPFLTDESEWNSNTPLPNILLQLQFLLANPGLDQPVNIAAAEIYTSAPHLYEQLIRDSVIASRRIRDGLPAFGEEFSELHGIPTENQPLPPEGLLDTEEPPSKPIIQMVSFDEYYEKWKTVATSLPARMQKDVGFPGEVIPHNADPASSSNAEFRAMMERQRELWFGKFEPKKPKPIKQSSEARQRVEAMRRLYRMPPAIADLPILPPLPDGASNHSKDAASVDNQHSLQGDITRSGVYKEEWEQDADALLHWSASLGTV